MDQKQTVPSGLRAWFIAHFLIDVAVAVPLFFSPVDVLRLFGWTVVDPLAVRLVAAALFAIGGMSFLARDSSPDVYLRMLDLKLVWSVAAMVGILLSLWEGAPPFAAGLFGVFFIFFFVWAFYRRSLKRSMSPFTFP